MPVAVVSRSDARLPFISSRGNFEARAALAVPTEHRSQQGVPPRFTYEKPPSASARTIDRQAYATEHRSSHLRTLLAVLSDPIAITTNSHSAAKDFFKNSHPTTTLAPQSRVENSSFGDYNSSNYSQLSLPALLSSPISPLSHVALSPDLKHAIYSTDPSSYARVCEPISEWLAEYMWKVVTVGLSLPCYFVNTGVDASRDLPPRPDAILADSICTLLLSTLLQPSVIVLALHYISRLPACVTHCAFDTGSVDKESMFYTTLTSPDSLAQDNNISKTLYAAFKLFVVGAILSNKILDDHVFTLKTWHEVSGIPLKSLNRLEWLSLDILRHDLCVDAPAWTHWLGSLSGYHVALCSQDGYVMGNDLSAPLMSHILETLVDSRYGASKMNEPLFLGFDERARAIETPYHPQCRTECSELDSDDEGPLREEYIPRKGLHGPTESSGLPSKFHHWDPSSAVQSNTDDAHHCPLCVPGHGSWPSTPLDPYPADHLPILESWEPYGWDEANRMPVPQSMFDSSACTIVGFSGKACGKELTLRDYFLSYTRGSNWVPA